jgi:hypothetical protein
MGLVAFDASGRAFSQELDVRKTRLSSVVRRNGSWSTTLIPIVFRGNWCFSSYKCLLRVEQIDGFVISSSRRRVAEATLKTGE